MPNFRHFVLPRNGQPEAYTATGGGSGTFTSPPRDRAQHAQKLVDQIRHVRDNADEQLAKQPATSDLHFIPVTFLGTTDADLDIDRLENKAVGIRVVNVRSEAGRQVATVAVPKGKTEHFEKRIEQYSNEDKDSGRPRHEELVTGINEIRLAVLQDYYTDSDCQPPGRDESIWWEVWLDTASVSSAVADFRSQATRQNIQVSDNTVRFPEVAVVLARTTLNEWSQFPGLLNLLAELRRASIVASEFMSLPPSDQAEFVDALCERTQYAPDDASAVCSLRRFQTWDSGFKPKGN